MTTSVSLFGRRYALATCCTGRCRCAGLCVLVGTVSVPKAQAFTVTQAVDPIQNAICYTGACTVADDLSGVVPGGDGTSISDYVISEVTNGFSGSPAVASEEASPGALEGLATTLGILDAPVAIGILGGAVLALGTADVIKHIREGSAAKSLYETLDLSLSSPLLANGGVSIGPYQSDLSKSGTDGTWFGSLGVNGPGVQWWSQPDSLADGYYLSVNATKAAYENFYGTSTGDKMYNDAQVFWANQSRMTVVNMTNAVSKTGGHPCPAQFTPCYLGYFTPAQYDAAFRASTAPWSGQAVNGTYGWANPATGAGLEPQGSGTLVPAPTALSSGDPTTICLTQGGVRSCGGGWSGSVDNPLSGADPGTQNLVRCVVDPADYVCPTPSSDGNGFSSNGGAAGPMPDCYGLSVGDCEAAILEVRPDAVFTVTTASTADPNVADGLVISTTPTAATDPTPGQVGVSVNPDTGDPQSCTGRTENPHWSDTPPVFTMLAKGYVTCNYTGETTVTMTMWMCTSSPTGGNPDALTGGAYGCGVVATVPATPVTVVADKEYGPIYCPGQAPWVSQLANYYIAVTQPSNGIPGWSPDGWFWTVP